MWFAFERVKDIITNKTIRHKYTQKTFILQSMIQNLNDPQFSTGFFIYQKRLI